MPTFDDEETNNTVILLDAPALFLDVWNTKITTVEVGSAVDAAQKAAEIWELDPGSYRVGIIQHSKGLAGRKFYTEAEVIVPIRKASVKLGKFGG